MSNYFLRIMSLPIIIIDDVQEWGLAVEQVERARRYYQEDKALYRTYEEQLKKQREETPRAQKIHK